MELCRSNREEDNNTEDCIKPIDPLLQLITLFSRTALTDRRCVFVCVCVHSLQMFTYSKNRFDFSRSNPLPQNSMINLPVGLLFFQHLCKLFSKLAGIHLCQFLCPHSSEMLLVSCTSKNIFLSDAF